MTNGRIFPLPTPRHLIPVSPMSPALHTRRAVLDIRPVLTQRVAMAQVSVSDALPSHLLTSKMLVVPAFSIAGLSVLVNDLARAAVHIPRLQGAVFV